MAIESKYWFNFIYEMKWIFRFWALCTLRSKLMYQGRSRLLGVILKQLKRWKVF